MSQRASLLDRRAFLGALGLLATPQASAAQARKPVRLAYVNSASETETRKPHLRALRGALAALGYVEGGNLELVVRFAEGASFAAGLNGRRGHRAPARRVAGIRRCSPGMRANTTVIPIVLTGALDPVRAGLAQSLARPGFNVTGSTQLMDQLVVKHVEILREILPQLRRIGQIVDATAPGCELIAEYAEKAARSIGKEFLKQAFARIQSQRIDALLPCPSPILFQSACWPDAPAPPGMH